MYYATATLENVTDPNLVYTCTPSWMLPGTTTNLQWNALQQWN